ncbi:hypothetical protein M5D96_010140 [Drosophila gunungcola]|uniref:Uncharacterized protein n=1 Tax=Drosophila gunungcola TaxID=103775 RepID=A0A9Q0BMA3_9MUSC|nr:hypothetical protein M5D96_010140 [Drosophila gunungcola]
MGLSTMISNKRLNTLEMKLITTRPSLGCFC